MSDQRANDSLILDRLLGIVDRLPRREREAVLAGASFRDEANMLREALENVRMDAEDMEAEVRAALKHTE